MSQEIQTRNLLADAARLEQNQERSTVEAAAIRIRYLVRIYKLIITDFLIHGRHGRSLKCQIQVFMSLNILEYLLLFVGSTTSSTVQPATAETGKAL